MPNGRWQMYENKRHNRQFSRRALRCGYFTTLRGTSPWLFSDRHRARGSPVRSRFCVTARKKWLALTGCYTPGFSLSPATDASDLSQAALPGGCDGLRLPSVLRAYGTLAQPRRPAHQGPVRFRKHAEEAREGMVA